MACRPLKFLTDQQVADIHEKLMARDGGLAGYREGARLAAILERIRNQIRFTGNGAVSAELLAAMTTFALAIGAPFNDGNRRTALACGLVALKVNGCNSEPEPVRLLRLVVAAGSDEADQETFLKGYLMLL
jgi:prophage maintenance system killer protein